MVYFYIGFVIGFILVLFCLLLLSLLGLLFVNCHYLFPLFCYSSRSFNYRHSFMICCCVSLGALHHRQVLFGLG